MGTKCSMTIKDYVLLSMVLFIQCSLIIFFAMQKHNLMVDEIWTFNLANANYFPFLGSAKEIFDQWLTNEFWYSHITVDYSSLFNYDAVFHNQAKDVHPPLYYIIIHSVCSFFPGEFSKWFGIIPNIVFFVLTQIVLFNVSNKFFSNKWHCYFPCIIYGFSWGAVNTVIFIRMYMMLTFFCILSFYLHILLNEKVESNKNYILILCYLFIVMLGGFLTQYYYLIFQSFLSGCFLIYWYSIDKINIIKKYLITSLSVFVVSYCVFPSWVSHILGNGYRGKEAIRNFAHSSLFDNTVSFLRLLNRDMFGGMAKYLVMFLLLFLLYKLIVEFFVIRLKCNDKKYELLVDVIDQRKRFVFSFTKETLMIFIAGLFTILYFITVAKIAPFKENRYIYNTYPFVALIIYYILEREIGAKYKNISVCMLVAVLFLSVNAAFMYRTKNIKFIDRGFRTVHSQIDSVDGIKQFIYVGRNHAFHRITSQVLDLAKVHKSYLLLEKDLVNFKWDELDNRVLVYKAGNCLIKASDFEKKIIENSKFNNFKKSNRELGTIYEFY